MRVYSLEELINIAKEKSPFYKKLYKNISAPYELEKIPLMDSHEFWASNSINQNQILTEAQSDGIVFKSGGTTGNPKFSFFTLEEWELFTQAFGEGMRKGGLKKGDKIANLFYAGDLYASFLFIMKSIEHSYASVTHFP
ncbi:MAG: hypothetical protein KDD45_05750, partial [Bdellovibrionales bacterium]|nr:hypothetical protein [Bdellovibrionales bacterium]